ncbi:MAG: DNA primase [Candidatus Eisenbacteria bacterium]
MRFSQEILEKVREACDVVEVIGEHVTLKKSGQNFKGLCPFHSERTPSFMVNPAKQVYHCFGCGAGGNVFSFVMQVENLSFAEAVRSLARRKGIEIPRPRTETDSLNASLLSAMEFAVSFYRKRLAAPEGRKARDYLSRRELGPKIQEEFMLGYSPAGWDSLLSAGRRYFGESVLLQAGLLVQREGGQGAYDRFRDRLMFPLHSPGGKAIGFGARALDDSEPKYLNSSDSPLFQKGSVLYGLYFSKRAVRAKESAIVVEGYTDLLSLYSRDFENVIASCGTAFTNEQAKVLRRYTTDATLIYDADDAGVRAARRALEIFLSGGLKVRLVCLPAGHDPDSFVRERGPAALADAIATAWSVTEFLVRTSPQSASREGKIRGLVRVFALIDDAIFRRLQIQEASEALRFDENTIAHEVSQVRKKGPGTGGVVDSGSGAVDRIEKELLRLIIDHEALLKTAVTSLRDEYFASPLSRQALGVLTGQGGGARLDPVRLLDGVENVEVRNLLASVMVEESFDYDDPSRVFQEYVRKLRLRWLTESIRTLEEEIRRKESTGEDGDVGALIAKLQSLASERCSLNGVR